MNAKDIFMNAIHAHIYCVTFTMKSYIYNCLFKCVNFFIYIIYLKKCLQKHNTVYIDKPTGSVIHSEVKKNLLS